MYSGKNEMPPLGLALKLLGLEPVITTIFVSPSTTNYTANSSTRIRVQHLKRTLKQLIYIFGKD
jgi:hypothetical protein